MKVTFQFVTRIFKKQEKKNIENCIQFTASSKGIYVRLIFFFFILLFISVKIPADVFAK